MELYAVTVRETDHGYLAIQSDFDMAIDADTLDNAIIAMKNQIEQEGSLRMKNNEEIPKPTILEKSEGNIIYVQTDIEKRFKDSATESVRKNISMPAWMDIRLRYYSVDASKLFQDAAISYLDHVENKEYKRITTIDELEKNVDESLLKEYAKKYVKEILA